VSIAWRMSGEEEEDGDDASGDAVAVVEAMRSWEGDAGANALVAVRQASADRAERKRTMVRCLLAVIEVVLSVYDLSYPKRK
jgi:hypothetical protein